MGFLWGLRGGLCQPRGNYRVRYYGLTLWRWFFGLSIMERNKGEDWKGHATTPEAERNKQSFGPEAKGET